jgi:dihydroorotase
VNILGSLLLHDFRLVDETLDMSGSVWIEQGIIREVFPQGTPVPEPLPPLHQTIRGGGSLVLMPALVDLHTHFRDPGYPEKETLESGCLAAVAGGYGTVVCMANTNPVIDSLSRSRVLKTRADTLGLVDLYPVLALTEGMEGAALSEIGRLKENEPGIRIVSEDGKDILSDALFSQAFLAARSLGVPLSCHCDVGGPEAAEAKVQGKSRAYWSRIEENHGTQRALALAKQAQGRVHIAHVSTKEAVDLIRKAKTEPAQSGPYRFTLTAEVTPHHLCLTEERAHFLGEETFGRVNPPLRTEADRAALIQGLRDGTIDAIATDHAPHREEDKRQGAPGFTGLETSFALCHTELALRQGFSLSRLSALMSAAPARILGLRDRGRIAPGFRGDLLIADPQLPWQIPGQGFRSRGKNSPYSGLSCTGRVLMTLFQGTVVYTLPGDSL